MLGFRRRRPVVWPGLAELIEDSFPGTGTRLAAARRWGVDWDEMATGHVVAGAGGPLAHAGLIGLPLVIHGERREVGHVHAVCTRPETRGRGHAREAVASAISASAERFETHVLLTTSPGLYEPLGFRTVPEYGARLDLARPVGGGRRAVLLEAERFGHVRRLARQLARRVPLSPELGVPAERSIFTLNECLSPLWWIRRLGVVVSWDLVDGALSLYDVAGPRVPRLGDLLAYAPGPVWRVEFHFAPENLMENAPEGRFSRWRAPGPEVLMARGPFVREGALVMLPRPWR